MDPVRRRPLIAVLLVVAAVAAGVAAAGEAPPPRRQAAPTPTPTPTATAPRPPGEALRALDAAAVRVHLRALARVAREAGGNRAAGTAGDRASVAYAREVLQGAGWEVRDEPVRFPFFREHRPPRVRLAGGARLRPARDARTMTYSGSGAAAGRVRAIGVAPGRASDAGCRRGDFRALRRGEIALVQRGTCTLRIKALNAQRAGAAAVLIPNDGLPGRTEAIRGTLGSPGVDVPVLALSTSAGTLAARAGRARVSVATPSERRRTVNLVAEAGDGPRVLMAGAHLDSVPDGPGLNDNGSGVAAVLAVAQALQGRAPAGARVRLGLWGAEELGLHGSRAHVRGLDRRERRALAGYVNLDMVGTPGRAPGVYGGDEAIERALRRALRGRGRDRITTRSAGRASDHAPFAGAGIAVGGVFTGLDRCYHRRCDDLGNVDAPLVADVAAATGTALLRLARR